MRCSPLQEPASTARACLRARDLRIVSPSSLGVGARIDHAIYQGGHFRLEAHVAAAPELHLHLTVPEPSALAPGDAIRLDVADGWVIPTRLETEPRSETPSEAYDEACAPSEVLRPSTACPATFAHDSQ